MLKKIGKILFITLGVIGILFLILVIIAMVTDSQETMPEETGSGESAQQIEAAAMEYDEEALREWIYDGAARNCMSISCNIKSDDLSINDIQTRLNEMVNEFYVSDPFFAYTVETVNTTTWDYEDYAKVELSYTYNDNPIPFDQLPRADDKNELLRQLQEQLNAGGTSYVFLLKGRVSDEDVAQITRELNSNNVEVAAESSSYIYYLTVGAGDYDLVRIELNYSVERERLEKASEEMRETLDRMAQEIRDRGIGDRLELYRAAARAVIASAEYDDDTRVATYTESLSDEQKIMRSAYGAVVSGRTICTGYAMAFKALCDRLDLPCWVVSGFNGDGPHAWNMIELNGETLYMDCTFADTAYDEWFLFMDEQELADADYYYSVNQLCPWAA
ncbi:MAG: hypothetical protein IJV41_00470 [Oscillospiraceae bacterium]|nr:hypothetical protein [Oscillospiraceae bacterium]